MSTINYKDGYLTASEFKSNRPDLAVHSTNAIQSAIYQASAMLNSHTDGKIKSVWDYTKNNTGTVDVNNDLYRTDVELDFISEALILQTQYLINLGNDLSIGSDSYALAGSTYSSSTPAARETIAPGVNQMLSRAKVYDFFAMGADKTSETGSEVFNPTTTYYNKLTVAELDARYQLAHPLLLNSNGKIATIQQGDGTNTSIVWTDPPTVDLQNYYTMSQVDNAIQDFWNTNIIPYASTEWCNSTFVKLNEYNQKIQTIDTTLQNNYNSIYSNTTAIAAVNDRVRVLEHKTGTGIDFSQYVTEDELTEQLGNYLTTSDASSTYVTKNNPVLNASSNNPVKVSCPANNPGYIEFVRNNSNGGYVGLGSSTTNDLMLGCRNGSVSISASNNQITMNNARVTSVANPTANSDAATKQYVDTAVANVTPNIDLSDYVTNAALTTQLTNYLPTRGGNLTGALTIKQASGNQGVVTNTSSWNSKNYVSTKYTSNITNISDSNTILKIETNITDNQAVIHGNNLTITGLATPTANNQAATKQYVDTLIANLPSGNSNILSGDNTFTGNNTFNNPVVVGTPTSDNQAATKQYVDNAVANAGGNANVDLSGYLQKTGGTVTGNLTIAASETIKQANGTAGVTTNTSTWQNKNFVSTKYTSNTSVIADDNTLLKLEVCTNDRTSSIKGTNLTISGLVAPIIPSQAATKQYVDDAVANAGGGSGNVDLSNYVTTSALTTQLGNYVTKTNPVLNSSNGNPVKIMCGAGNPSYIEFIRNNTNGGYVGLGSSSHNNLMLGCRSGSVQLVPSNNQVDVSNSRIVNVSNPTGNNDAANKAYVDNVNTTLSNRVTTLENQQQTSGARLSKLSGKVYISGNLPTSVSSGQSFSSNSLQNITTNNNVTIPFRSISKYVINESYFFNATEFLASGSKDLRAEGYFIQPDSSSLIGSYITGNQQYSVSLTWLPKPGNSSGNTVNVTWISGTRPYINVTWILSDTLENITRATASVSHSTPISLFKLGEEESTIEITSWENI